MTVYAISIKIDYDSPSSWSERYDSLMAAILKCPKVWSETTSLCVVETPETLEQLETRLWLTKFDSSKDILLVAEIGHVACALRGAAKDKLKLKSLLPRLQLK